MAPRPDSESAIQREILRYLNARNILAWKVGVGAMWAKYGNRTRFVKFGTTGQPDLIGVLPGGRMLAIEVKTKTGKLTAAQNLFLAQIAKAGGAAMICRSVAQCHDYITELLGGTDGATRTAPHPPASPEPGHGRRSDLETSLPGSVRRYGAGHGPSGGRPTV